MSEKPTTEPFDSPGVASVEEGHVILDGPDGIAITLTIGAARQTGERLIAAADAAARQVADR
ncbi:hypothetical protein KY084_15250 [Stakelama sp. CBK3Z-3]|uniref:Uncharacterized protein n=1 Tax=Stakelama flava TaxID=2860338 RepID=A0ABS6XPR7_9SPHN|nr:hypothetical protein [Stakelama flava]MBW4332217.1 hypothetical protein [Stakelama flava]